MTYLSAVGFWVGGGETDAPLGLPHPNDLPAAPDPALADLLEAGQVVEQYRGFSSCRVCGAQNGSAEQSNGYWLWPSGLAHVVREHGVSLPGAFIESLHGAPRRVPPGAAVQADHSEWLRWAATLLPPGPDASGAIALEQAREVVARLQTPGSRFALDEEAGRWRLSVSYADRDLVDFASRRSEAALISWVTAFRASDPSRVLTWQQANAMAPQVSRQGCSVEVTGVEDGRWAVVRRGPDFGAGTAYVQPTDGPGWLREARREVDFIVMMSQLPPAPGQSER